jgi:hypothetical protein
MNDLDARIMQAIGGGCRTFRDIALALNMPLDSREIDRALQRLRKANKIRRAGVPVGWCLGGVQKPCPTCGGRGTV